MSENLILPFSQLKQNALLGHLLINEKLFKMIYKKVQPSWFLSERNANVYKLLIAYYDKYKNFPTIHELQASSEVQSLDPKERNITIAYISRSIMETQQISLEAIKPDLTEWLHTVILMNALNDAQDSFNSKDIKKCHTKLMEAVREVTSTSFDGGDAVDFLNYQNYLKQAKEERKLALTTGLKVFDSALLENATDGGLQYGDTTVVMAPVNVGKTTFLITVACENIIRGKDVLFMTHEGRPEDIRLKFLSNLLQCPISEIFNLYNSPEGMKKLTLITGQLDKHLKYIPYNKAGQMYIENVVPIIRNSQEDWMASHSGKGFDMLVSDYPALLSTEQARKGNLAKRNIDMIVYDHYVQLGLEYKFHNLLAIQTNREGSKINKGISSQHRLIEMEDVKESWDPMAEASNVITLNRSPKSQEKGLITFNVAKSRSNKTGVRIVARTNFACSATHSETLGAMAYEGSGSPDELAENIWEQYKNQTITAIDAMKLGI